MKVILILYVIGIILYWLGIASLISTIKKNKEQVREVFKNRKGNKRSTFSNRLVIITGSIIPILHYAFAYLYIFRPDYALGIEG